MAARFLTATCVVFLATSLLRADEPEKPKPPPKDLPDTTESAKLPDTMPKTVSGRVTLDGKPLAGVRITDGIDFVSTDADGKYSITLKPAPMIPYTPSRSISICWPSGTWPTRAQSGKFNWWVRLMDIQDPANVNFELVKREQKLPVVVTFGTDPHDNFTRAHNYYWMDETARAGDHVTFAVCGGDLGYIGFGNAADAYTLIRKFTHEFPVLMPHCVGNHDIPGMHSPWWKTPHEHAGNGAFIKYVGPIRWSFDVAGIHFVGMDWALEDAKGHIQLGMSDSAIDWLERDLAAQPKGTPIYFFNHQPWSPNKRFYEVLGKYGVKLCLGGHSHRNMYLGGKNPEFWTKMSEYTLLYASKDRFDVVDRCVYKKGRNGWDGRWDHHGRACALYHLWPQSGKDYKGEHHGLKDLTLTSEARTVEPVKSATYDVRIGARGAGDKPAARYGVRITGADGETRAITYDAQAGLLDLMGLKTYFYPSVPKRGQEKKHPDANETWVELRILVMPDRVRILAGSRLHYHTEITIGKAQKIEFFAEDGAAEFGRVDVWQHDWPDYKPTPQANSG